MDYDKLAIHVARRLAASVATEGMTLDEFEAAGHEPWQVTRGQWVDLMRRYSLGLGQSPDDAGYQTFHEGDVARALEAGRPVSEEVLRDYPSLADKVSQQQKQADDFRRLTVGDPISVKINYFGTMADGFFVGFLPDGTALVYIKVKGRSRAMRFGQYEVFARDGGGPTPAQAKAIEKWRGALDRGEVAAGRLL